MLIAREKLRTNVAEYVLYMWQLEDLMRANQLDIDRVEQIIINGFDESDAVKEEMREWYGDLIQQMKDQGLQEHGHLASTAEIITELALVHRSLVNIQRDDNYRELFRVAFPLIAEFQQAAQTYQDEITTCFHGLYSQMLLRLKDVPISAETQAAFKVFGMVVAYLSAIYHKTNPAAVEE